MKTILKSFIKKQPFIYRFYKNKKFKFHYNEEFFKKSFDIIEKLFDSINNQSFLDYKKERYFSYKNTFSDTAYIEINNSCNINCVMCDTKSSTRVKRVMKEEDFEKALISIKSKGIKFVGLHTIGDPLANPKLEKYFSLLRKYKMNTALSSNGLMLKRHLATLKKYIDICSFLRFSMDGASKKTYEKIRVGGKWEDLLENFDIAVNELLPLGYNLGADLVITAENFDELGKYITLFGSKLKFPYANIHFNFMNSLSPNNDYFIKNNVIPEHTYTNKYCEYVSRNLPYVLVDSNISVCCRDYDGSLTIGSLNKTKNLSEVFKDDKLKDLQKAHEDEKSNSMGDYNLCSSCYVTDNRIQQIWSKAVSYLIFKNQNESSEFYQEKINLMLKYVKTLDKDNFLKVL